MNTFTPVKDLQTALRKISEYNRAVPAVLPDGIFGNQTESSLREFQKEYGLTETGVADFNTHTALFNIYNDIILKEEPPLPLSAFGIYSLPVMKGAKGSYVILLQAILKAMSMNNKSFLPVEITGSFGEETENAVKKIQSISGIPETGTLNKETWNAITVLYPGN